MRAGVYWYRPVRCRLGRWLILALLALVPCCGFAGRADLAARYPLVYGSWQQLEREITQAEGYRGFREFFSSKAVPFSLQDIAHPEASPPAGVRVRSLHTLLNRYTDYIYAWQDRLLRGLDDRGLLDRSGEILNQSSATLQQQLREYILWNDPLLLSALTHLIQVVRYSSGLVSDVEKHYLELRLLWLKQFVLLEQVEAEDWDSNYHTLYDGYRCWKTAATPREQTVAQLMALGGRLKSRGKARLSSHRLFRRSLNSRTYNGQLSMQTVWDAWVDLGHSGMLNRSYGCLPDPLLPVHAGFVWRGVSSHCFFTPRQRVERLLSRAWLQLAAIEAGVPDVDAEWRSWLENYQLPEPRQVQDFSFLVFPGQLPESLPKDPASWADTFSAVMPLASTSKASLSDSCDLSVQDVPGHSTPTEMCWVNLPPRSAPVVAPCVQTFFPEDGGRGVSPFRRQSDPVIPVSGPAMTSNYPMLPVSPVRKQSKP